MKTLVVFLGLQLLLSLRRCSCVLTMDLRWSCRFVSNYSINWNAPSSISWLPALPMVLATISLVWLVSLVSWLGVDDAVTRGLRPVGLYRVFLLCVFYVALVVFFFFMEEKILMDMRLKIQGDTAPRGYHKCLTCCPTTRVLLLLHQ